MMMDAAAPARRAQPLGFVLVLSGLLGGAAGGLTVALVVTIWDVIESGDAEVWALAGMVGLITGTLLGLAMGVAAALFRLIGVRFGLRGELVAVAAGAVIPPFVFGGILGPVNAVWVVLLIPGVLAAWHFCRMVLKRARQEAPEIGTY
jgi:hypothetical protein